MISQLFYIKLLLYLNVIILWITPKNKLLLDNVINLEFLGQFKMCYPHTLCIHALKIQCILKNTMVNLKRGRNVAKLLM